MADDELSRKTISMESGLYSDAEKRWRSLGYSSFSEYVQFLLSADLADRSDHVTKRSETSGAQHSKIKDKGKK